ncbi:TetR/AcrR family transcriptional regulator [Actinocorallia sp. B10E7]|uniref:TetR/AcrR family transcriptional regulator n=1 Tax=Actinocorallia sp. B10E7 TaxID=3153558 RepID=UPI00325CFF5B
MARLTRPETQARNREHLLSAAERLFLRDGYQSVSIAKIADEAGLSTGAVYSNFTGKQEIALHVVRGVQERYASRLEEILHTIPDPNALRALREWADDGLASGWPRLELEFALDAKSDTALLEAEAGRHRSVVARLARSLEKISPAMAPLATQGAEAIINLAIGVAVRHVIDPTVTAQPIQDLLETLFAATGLTPGAAESH